MRNRDEIIHSLRSCFHSFGSTIDELTADQWQVQSLCPEWTIKGVVEHAVTFETLLLGWRPGLDDPLAAVAAVASGFAGLSPSALRHRYHDVVNQRLFELEAMTDDEFDAPSFTPVGQATYARFIAVRVFDMWVHERDIRVPLGLPTQDAGVAAEMSLDEVEGSIGYIAGKKIGVPDGQGIAFHITGPVRRDIYVKVDGRAACVEALRAPDATITADSLTFMLLACGRIDPQAAIASGRITWTGDDELGSRAARNLAFTM